MKQSVMHKESLIKIQQRFGLNSKPDIQIVSRKLSKLADGWSYELEQVREVAETAEYYCSATFYKNNELANPIEEFRNEYPQLFLDSDKNKGFDVVLRELVVSIGKFKISAGFNWLIFGEILGKSEKFAAVIYVYIRDLFKNCGLSALLKSDEIEFCKEQHCAFVQTWHAKDNPFFYQAIAPSLDEGYILYHGTDAGGEQYEKEGFVHLRKYFRKTTLKSVVVIGKDSKKYVSPVDNKSIKDVLKKSRRTKYKGKDIIAIKMKTK